ncbi:MAG: FtsX-like permease family protein, partial [Ruminococcus sp.]|nr:FtsX-like permease family protein [Ruminococcus sp.]
TADIIFTDGKDSEHVLKTMSLPENINGIRLREGRLPESPDECVIDSAMTHRYSLGDRIYISESCPEDSAKSLSSDAFTVVGIADSSLYINFERGTSSIGSGSLSGFLYVPREAFDMDALTDIYIRFDQDCEIYSDAYEDYMSAHTPDWETLVQERADERFEELISGTQTALPAGNGLLSRKYPRPDTYVLGRGTNIGYACFESDSEIVEQVARVFPIFFILVAALVCMTTMSRMVEERRTQIGVLKALGYSERAIMGSFMFYSGSAAVLGCVLGYAVGIILFPTVIWVTYELMYLPLKIHYVINPALAAAAVSISLACSLGTTWISCRYELNEPAASLMRPKAPKAGKRVLLERIGFIWKRMKFLHKVSVRNIFRYKKRFFMMIAGISGCTALLVTGFGLKDSIAGFAEMQYEQIQTADAQLSLHSALPEEMPDTLKTALDENTEDYTLLRLSPWDLVYGTHTKSIELAAPLDTQQIGKYFRFKDMDGTLLTFPSEGEAIVSHSVSERYGADVGDEITLRDDSMRELHVTVTGVFENHVYNYIFIAPETLEAQLREPVEYNCAYIDLPDGADVHKLSAELKNDENVTSITVHKDLKERLSNMMSSLDYVVLLIILSAAGLAFVVIYNLTNINITERIREIATIKVLGFFRSETSAYVLRENIVLTGLGTALGLVLGMLLHRFVMAQIVVDMVDFNTTVQPVSFLLSVVLTFVFNFVVNLFMQLRLERINMAESLKSVD